MKFIWAFGTILGFNCALNSNVTTRYTNRYCIHSSYYNMLENTHFIKICNCIYIFRKLNFYFTFLNLFLVFKEKLNSSHKSLRHFSLTPNKSILKFYFTQNNSHYELHEIFITEMARLSEIFRKSKFINNILIT